ncbi:hypothetical protein JQK87_09800 [Streptomyces sp. G44]|nr:hypothetical protein [Streptomyces sp. G44]MBM7168698.1 hypothetical protein [Streptomyces sp. G44]
MQYAGQIDVAEIDQPSHDPGSVFDAGSFSRWVGPFSPTASPFAAAAAAK